MYFLVRIMVGCDLSIIVGNKTIVGLPVVDWKNRYTNLYIYILESYLISVAKCNHLLVFNIGCADRQDPIIAWPWDDNVIFARLIKLINYANCVRTAGRACRMSEAYICAGAVDLEVDRGALMQIRICFVECSRRDAVTEIYVISD